MLHISVTIVLLDDTVKLEVIKELYHLSKNEFIFVHKQPLYLAAKLQFQIVALKFLLQLTMIQLFQRTIYGFKWTVVIQKNNKSSIIFTKCLVEKGNISIFAIKIMIMAVPFYAEVSFIWEGYRRFYYKGII